MALTEKQQKFLDVLFLDEEQGGAGGDASTAMKLAGYAEGTSVSRTLEPLKDEIIEHTKQYLARNAPKAAMSFVDVLDDPTGLGNKDVIAAASQVLDRIGLVKTDKMHIETPNGGIAYLPLKKEEPSEDDRDEGSNV